MAIKREDLNEEQKKQIDALYKKYFFKGALAAFAYFGFLFFANFTVIVLNLSYFQNPQFHFFGIVGNTFITIMGLRGTIEEQRTALVEEVKKVVGQV